MVLSSRIKLWDHSYITSAQKGERGVGQMLTFADEGGRGVLGNADVSISFFEKVFLH